MVLSEAAFGLCLVFLICTFAAQAVAVKNGDTRQLHSLHLIKIGLSLCACAYLFHLYGKSPGDPLSLLSLAFRLGGITFLWIAWKDHWIRQREGLAQKNQSVVQESDESLPLQTVLPPAYAALYSGLNSRAREAFCAAQEEALRRRQCCVDTDHLLLGLLQVPYCTASGILLRCHIPAEMLRQDVARLSDPEAHPVEEPPAEAPATGPALTHRARQVMVMAEMEAHRFGKTFIGTEHLLLGLLLIGSGPAASALFKAGLTVDGLRREVIAASRN